MGICDNSDMATIRQHESYFLTVFKIRFLCDWLKDTNERAENKSIPWNALPVLPLDKSITIHLSSQMNNAGYIFCLYCCLVCSSERIVFRKKKKVFLELVASIRQRDGEREKV